MEGADHADAAPESGPSKAGWPTAPIYHFDSRPTEEGVVQAREITSEVRNNFFRSARWCADGSAILTATEDRVIRIYETPFDGVGNTVQPPRVFTQPDAIHATAWYPSASVSAPETYCFMTSARDGPVRLIDATDGRSRATYPIVDHRERFVAPYSLAFNPSATKAYCGHENAIEVLDIASPGYGSSERLKMTLSRNEKGGQKGIISALAFSPDYSGTYAAGSFSGSVSLYSEDTGATPLQHLEGVSGGGVTQVAFHPSFPTILFVASRRSDAIQAFDLRDTSAPFAQYHRAGLTNQRLCFDVDPWGRYLASGDTEGVVKVWDISDMSKTEPVFEQRLYHGSDAVGSVQLHPYKPLLLSASGSRSFEAHKLSDGSQSASSASSSDEDEEEKDNEDYVSQDDIELDAEHQGDTPGFSRRKSKPITRSSGLSTSAVTIWSFQQPNSS